jgi:hypothetical protein
MYRVFSFSPVVVLLLLVGDFISTPSLFEARSCGILTTIAEPEGFFTESSEQIDGSAVIQILQEESTRYALSTIDPMCPSDDTAIRRMDRGEIVREQLT